MKKGVYEIFKLLNISYKEKMKLLLHTCCAPCSVYCIKSLREEGIEPIVYWFNPNIHPYMEYKARRDTLKEYTKSIRHKCYI
mgnify:CR=1 FL=1